MRTAMAPGNGDWLPFPLGLREGHAGCGKGCLSPFSRAPRGMSEGERLPALALHQPLLKEGAGTLNSRERYSISQGAPKRSAARGLSSNCCHTEPRRARRPSVIPNDSPSVIPSAAEGSGWGKSFGRTSPARVTGATLPSLARTRPATTARRSLPLADQRLSKRRPDPLDRARARDGAQQRPAPGLGVAEVRVRFQESWAHLMGILSTDLGARLVFFEIFAHVRSVMCGFRHSDRSEGSRWGRPLPRRNMERSPR